MTYIAKFWRGNPQLKNGGYETTREIEAKNIQQARAKANALGSRCVYGSMNLIEVHRATAEDRKVM